MVAVNSTMLPLGTAAADECRIDALASPIRNTRSTRTQPRAHRELREAHRLYTEMGATGHAERLARELGL